jgi:hypothetical protein
MFRALLTSLTVSLVVACGGSGAAPGPDANIPSSCTTHSDCPGEQTCQLTYQAASKPSAGLCCDAHAWPGCDSSVIESCVCELRPSCCTDQWTEECALSVAADCGQFCAEPAAEVSLEAEPGGDTDPPSDAGSYSGRRAAGAADFGSPAQASEGDHKSALPQPASGVCIP